MFPWNKPFGNVRINTRHPFADGFLMCIPFTDTSWDTTDTATKWRPQTLWGATVPRTPDQATGTVDLVSNYAGNAIQCTTQASRIGGWSDFIPLTGVTICIIRRLLTAAVPTGTGGAIFLDQTAAGNERVGAFAPYIDGTLYWSFALANTLTIASLPLTTTEDRFVFTAGFNGMAVWRNGVKIGSSSTAVSRGSLSGSVYLNGGANAGAIQEFNFLQVNDYPWSDSLCAWWSAEPYAHLLPDLTESLVGVRGAGGGKPGAGGKGRGNPGINIINPGGAQAVNIGNPGFGVT